MSNLTWETFYSTDFDAFGEAAKALSNYIDEADLRGALIEDIGVLKDDAGDHERDDFDGEVADEVRAQAKRIVELFEEDLSEFADRLCALCEDAAEAFETKRRELANLFAETGPYLSAAGGPGEEHFEVAESALYNYLTGSGYIDPMPQAEADAYERQVRERAADLSADFKELMDAVRDLDDDYDARFRAVNDEPPPLPPFVGSADYLEKAALYDAERAAEYLTGGEDGELSEAELSAFNALASYWGDDPAFATNLMNELGPDGLYEQLSMIETGDAPYSDGQIRAAWESLGVALAAATDPANEPHVADSWTEGFIEQGFAVSATGGEEIRGFQLVAPLLEHGDYAEDFLVPVGDEMLALDAQDLWLEPGEHHSLNLGSHGANPVNYLLDALDRNPEAALEFFNEHRDPEPTISGNANVDPFEYLLDRAANGPQASPDLALDANMIGNALESATTGFPSDTELTADTDLSRHTNHQTALTERLIEYVLNNGDQFQADDATNVLFATDGGLAPMVDNLGDITTHYMADFHRAMAGADGVDDAWVPQPYGIGLDLNGLDVPLTPAGEEIPGKAATEAWFRILGNDPETLDTVWNVSEGMMYAEVDAASSGENWKFETAEAIGIHAELAAALTEGALDRAADTADAEADQINTTIDYGSKAVSFGVGAGLAYAGMSPGEGLFTSTAANEAIAFTANQVKGDADWLYPDPIAAQSDVYAQVRGQYSLEATAATINQILIENGHGSEADLSDRTEVVNGYGATYANGVNEYLSGQDDEAGRN
jgi:hypothetical protein